jgi:UDPglucose--hexose-1-phosphate uridylyltransferase
MRQDPLTGEWISVATARHHRPVQPSDEHDPLAPASPEHPTEVPGTYDVVVFENKFPSFGPGLPVSGDPPDDSADGRDATAIGRWRPAYGRCEVISFGPQQTGSFADLGISRARTIVEAWADRSVALSALPGVQQVFPFANCGAEIGVTLRHPHGQIYAYPYVTPRTSRLLDSIRSYGSGLMADILEFEQKSERVLIRGEHFTVFVPFAARWPVEIHMLPHRHVPDIGATTSAERDEIAVLYSRTLRAIDRLHDSPTPYTAAWHQAPVHYGREQVRLMLQVTSPRRSIDTVKHLAGSEWAMGGFICDIAPEESAERLRDALAADSG